MTIYAALLTAVVAVVLGGGGDGGEGGRGQAVQAWGGGHSHKLVRIKDWCA